MGSARGNSLSLEGGVVLCWQEGLYPLRPGAANMRVIGNLAGNVQLPRGVWEERVRQFIVSREKVFFLQGASIKCNI